LVEVTAQGRGGAVFFSLKGTRTTSKLKRREKPVRRRDPTKNSIKRYGKKE